jgi:threonyl-tRNA synthetase
VIGVDITELTKLKDHVSFTQKLANLGEMFAGIIHDINNPLMMIEANAKRAKKKIGDEEVLELLNNYDIRGFVDDRNEKIGKKIRESELKKIPFMLIVGEEEEKNGTISVRQRGQEGKGNISVTIEQFAVMINEEINKTLKQF